MALVINSLENHLEIEFILEDITARIIDQRSLYAKKFQ